MGKSMIAIIILAVTLLFMLLDRIPMVVTALRSALAMTFTGVLTPDEAFSGLSSAAILSVIGFGIISSAFLSSGLSEEIGDVVNRWIAKPGRSEKREISEILYFNGFLSILL